MLLLHCLPVVIALCLGSILICNLLALLRAPGFHNLPSDFTQQISPPCKISFIIFTIFSPPLPIKQIVSQTSHFRLPGVLYWCCALFAICHSTAVSPSPEKASLPSREQLYFSSGGSCPSSQFCSIFHSLAVPLHLIKRCLLHCTPDLMDRSVGRGSTPCRAAS